MKRFVVTVAGLLLFLANAFSQAKEPYKFLHDGAYAAPVVKASPDPLIHYQWKNPLASDSLQLYFLPPHKTTAVPAKSFTQKENSITVVQKGDLRFDFGTEAAGWLEFESDDLSGDIEMSISEYNEPAIVNAGAQNPIKTKKPVRYGNTYRLEVNDGLYEGVRFGWIHVRSFSKAWHIKKVRLICQVKPMNYKGSFYTNDTMLNRIWYTGAFVVKQNILQDYFGAILMERSDRHSWTGDAYPAQAAALAAFGNYDAIKKNIEFTSSQDNGIAAYSIYWVLSLIDYYNYTGDADFLKAYAANAGKRLETAYNHYDSLPNLGFMGWDERLGAGFENTQIDEAQQTYKMLCINGWKQFAAAMASVNETAMAKKYEQFAETKTRQWQISKKDNEHFGIHSISEAINAGFLQEGNIKQLSQELFADKLNRLSYSPFNQYFIIEAMALAKQNQIALETIKDCWGGQIMYGGTNFFEVYRPSWNKILQANDAPPNNQCGYTSLAHPWGAGVTKWLSENILGIRPLQPGFKTFSILPFLNDKLTNVKGSMPTVFGTIAADFDIVSGKCIIEIPAGTVAEKIGLPKAGMQIKKIVVSKKGIGKNDLYNTVVVDIMEEDESYRYLKNIPAGQYKIMITYTGKVARTERPVEQYNYPVHSFVQDSITTGNWENKYGRDGYKLFGYPSSANAEKLPAYVEGITLKKNGTIVWDSLSVNSNVLKNPLTEKSISAAIITKDPEACNQTMTIDIVVKQKHLYKLSLYFLDWDKKERRSAIELFDLQTLNILAPVQMIKQYEKGKYITFSFDRSVRIRVNQVRGQNAAVSGLFFDSFVIAPICTNAAVASFLKLLAQILIKTYIQFANQKMQ